MKNNQTSVSEADQEIPTLRLKDNVWNSVKLLFFLHYPFTLGLGFCLSASEPDVRFYCLITLNVFYDTMNSEYSNYYLGILYSCFYDILGSETLKELGIKSLSSIINSTKDTLKTTNVGLRNRINIVFGVRNLFWFWKMTLKLSLK